MKKSIKKFWSRIKPKLGLVLIMILLSLLAFAVGYLTCEYTHKKPLTIVENHQLSFS